MGNRILVDQTNLMMLLMMGDEERIVAYIKQQGKMLDLNDPINRCGDTVAHYAAYKGYRQVLKYIASNHANLSATNHRKITPRELASPEVREYISTLIDEKEEKE